MHVVALRHTRHKNVKSVVDRACLVLCAQTHKHGLPGLCHCAAVTATSPRASAHPQLLSRFTPIKVVCEFPKTRHLPAFLSPPPPCILSWFFFSLQCVKKMNALLVLLGDLLTFDLPAFATTWTQQRGSVSAVGWKLPLQTYSFFFLFACNVQKYPLSVFLPLSSFRWFATAHGAQTPTLLK